MNKRSRQLLAILVFPFLLEGVLALHHTVSFHRKTVFLPNSTRGRNPSSEFLPGVSGPARFTVNSLGLRGAPPRQGDRFVVAFGTSTTECLWLDDAECWPQRLEDRLREAGKRVTVNTAARSGLRTEHAALQLEALLEAENPPDVALLMSGSTEFVRAVETGQWQPLTESERRCAFANRVTRRQGVPDSLGQTLLSQYWDEAEQRIAGGFRAAVGYAVEMHRDGREHAQQREFFAQNTKYEILSPPQEAAVDRALADFRRQVERFVTLCRAHGIEPVLISQPCLYGPDMPAEYARRYLSRIGGAQHRSMSPRLFHAVLGRFAAAMQEAALRHEAEFVDLYARLSVQYDSFYDQVHFNEEGAHRAAALLTQALAHTR